LDLGGSIESDFACLSVLRRLSGAVAGFWVICGWWALLVGSKLTSLYATASAAISGPMPRIAMTRLRL
jgi:hypothetical protein